MLISRSRLEVQTQVMKMWVLIKKKMGIVLGSKTTQVDNCYLFLCSLLDF